MGWTSIRSKSPQSIKTIYERMIKPTIDFIRGKMKWNIIFVEKTILIRFYLNIMFGFCQNEWIFSLLFYHGEWVFVFRMSSLPRIEIQFSPFYSFGLNDVLEQIDNLKCVCSTNRISNRKFLFPMDGYNYVGKKRIEGLNIVILKI